MLYLAYEIWISKYKQCRTARNYVEPCIFVSIEDIIVKFGICADFANTCSVYVF